MKGKSILGSQKTLSIRIKGKCKENTANIRIAMLGQKRVPSREGGIEVVVEELAVRMVSLGYDVTCYNRRGHHVSGRQFDGRTPKKYKGIRLKNVFTLNIRGYAAVTSSIVGAFYAAFGKYDVVHFHAEGPSFMCWLPKLLGKRVVVTIHGLDHKRAKWGKLARIYIMLGERNAVKYADRIIVLSDSIKHYFEHTYGRDTVLIPNGVNRPEIREAKEIKQFGLKKDSYILFLGRIVPEKGLQYLMSAFKDLKTDKKLVIAGGSSDTELFLKELQAMGADDRRIIFTGFVQGRLFEELYSNAFLYVLPSDLEGMPLSLLEAMSYGCCCVTSDIDECISIVEDKAIVCRKADVDDLKEKLQMLCDNPRVVGMYKAQAAEFICGKYNWDNVVERTIETYKGINKGAEIAFHKKR